MKQLCESLHQTCKREKKWLLFHTDKISLGRKPATGKKKKKKVLSSSQISEYCSGQYFRELTHTMFFSIENTEFSEMKTYPTPFNCHYFCLNDNVSVIYSKVRTLLRVFLIEVCLAEPWHKKVIRIKSTKLKFAFYSKQCTVQHS